LPLLDCACALAFDLACHCHTKSSGKLADLDAASASCRADSRQPPVTGPAALQRISARISMLLQNFESAQRQGSSADSERLAASQITELLIDWAPDFAAAEPQWRQLYGHAATAAGFAVKDDSLGSADSTSQAEDTAAPTDAGVGEKVRPVGWSRRSVTWCTKAVRCLHLASEQYTIFLQIHAHLTCVQGTLSEITDSPYFEYGQCQHACS
jgi:hypothetical protein